MRDVAYLQKKRAEILEAIRPICNVFGINDYDYEINETYNTEVLRIGDTRIGCSCNSESAVIQELVGYIFIWKWRGRSLGAFDKQTKNVIKQYWERGDRVL